MTGAAAVRVATDPHVGVHILSLSLMENVFFQSFVLWPLPSSIQLVTHFGFSHPCPLLVSSCHCVTVSTAFRDFTVRPGINANLSR